MGNLPIARTENCVAGAPVSHNLINEIQDNIIGNNHGLLTLTFGGPAFVAVSATGLDYSFGDIRGSGASFEIRATLPMIVGRRITAVRIHVNDNATGPTKLAASLLSIQGTPTLTNTVANGTPNPTAGTGADQIITIGPLTTTVAAVTAYNLKVQTTTGSAAVVVKVVEVDYDNIP